MNKLDQVSEIMRHDSAVDRRDFFRRAAILATLGTGVSSCGAVQTEVNEADLSESKLSESELREIEEISGKCTELIDKIEGEPQEYPLEDAEVGHLPERVELVEINGDPNIGTINWIRQMHAYNSGETATAEEMERDKLANIKTTVAYQERILKELQETKPKHVFIEGFASRFIGPPPGDRRVTNIADMLKLTDIAEKLFNSQTALSDQDQAMGDNFIYENGAGPVYCLLNRDDVTPHGLETSTAYEIDKIQASLENFEKALVGPCKVFLSAGDRGKKLSVVSGFRGFFQNLLEGDGRYADLVYQREYDAFSILADFFEKHPGEKATMIYGAGHVFCPYKINISDKTPLFKSVLFPQLYEKCGSSYEQFMEDFNANCRS